MSHREMLYDIMNGHLTDIETFKIGDLVVENEFARGKKCCELYEQVYEAERRLCKRLNVDEDPDVELIVGHMFEIARILSTKMYDCGVESGKQECM